MFEPPGSFFGSSSFGNHFCYLCFMFVFVMLSCLFLAALWSPAGKGLTSRLSCVLSFLLFCHFSKYILIHIRTKGEVGTVKQV